MKKPTQKQELHILRRQKYQDKRRINERTYDPHRILFEASRRNSKTTFDVLPPANFNLQFENCVEVIGYINNIKRAATLENTQIININFSDVIDIREGAIAMLLSVLNEIRTKNIYIRGIPPTDPAARVVLENSGFFKFVKRNGKKYVAGKSINLLRTGKWFTSPDFLGDAIRIAMNTVWGIKGRNPYVRTVIFEMMRNSIDHAFRTNKEISWHLSISHDEINKIVKFSFVDNGKGILDTLKENILKAVIRFFKGDEDILDTAFRNGIESRTGLPWRGKGLPEIFETLDEGYIKNLLVISNDVFLSFNNRKELLPISFKGTYYYWEVDSSCAKACFL